MLNLTKVCIFIILQNIILVQCMIPNLSVRKVDRKVIQRKREDTLEICRIYNEGIGKIESPMSAEPVATVSYPSEHRRVKRNVDTFETTLKPSDLAQVENVVEKMYDDLEEKGQKIAYRSRQISTTTVKLPAEKESGRRFDFAPKLLDQNLTAFFDNDINDTDVDIIIPWTKNWKHGIVPYFVDPKTYDFTLIEAIRDAFDYFEKRTCIRLQRLREKPTDMKSLQQVEWIYISNPMGIRQCVHSNEKKPNKGVQVVVFGYDCMSQGEILHEIMHVLGFSHEHTRPDRDDYVTILWDNIKPGYKKYFTLRTDDTLMTMPYDYDSVLHYPPRAFSRNGQLTIKAENKTGQRDKLSETDAEKVRLIYAHQCKLRNKEYLNTTCKIVNNIPKYKPKNVTEKAIDEYFERKIWDFSIINYRFRDEVDFTVDEIENIKAVMSHIEAATCIEFRETVEDANNATTGTTKKYKTTVVLSDNEINSDHEKLKSDHDTSNNESPEKQNLVSEEEPSKLIENLDDDDKHKLKAPENNEIDKEEKKVEEIEEEIKVISPSRKHAANTILLARSAQPGCKCPKESGRPRGNMVLEISQDCFNTVNDLLHLFVHLLGLEHQHQMYDRDYYLYINWAKLPADIAAEMKDLKKPEASLNFKYDYQSVMHFPWLQIRDGITHYMYPVWNDGWSMGHWQGLSFTDVLKLNRLYEKECQRRKEWVETHGQTGLGQQPNHIE